MPTEGQTSHRVVEGEVEGVEIAQGVALGMIRCAVHHQGHPLFRGAAVGAPVESRVFGF